MENLAESAHPGPSIRTTMRIHYSHDQYGTPSASHRNFISGAAPAKRPAANSSSRRE